MRGDDLQGDALLEAVADGLGGCGANLVADAHKAEGRGRAFDGSVGSEVVHFSDEQHAVVGGEGLQLRADALQDARRVGQHELGRAHDVGAPVLEDGTGELGLGREGDHAGGG